MHPWRFLPLVLVGLVDREQQRVMVFGDGLPDGSRRCFRDWMGKGNAEGAEKQRRGEGLGGLPIKTENEKEKPGSRIP